MCEIVEACGQRPAKPQPLSSGALHGITRGTASDRVAGLGISTAEPNMTRYNLYNADECFLTGTGAEIVPVVKIDQRVIGNGKPGPVTKKVVKAYQDLTKVSGEPIARRGAASRRGDGGPRTSVAAALVKPPARRASPTPSLGQALGQRADTRFRLLLWQVSCYVSAVVARSNRLSWRNGTHHCPDKCSAIFARKRKRRFT